MKRLSLLPVLALALFGCAPVEEDAATPTPASSPATQAVASEAAGSTVAEVQGDVVEVEGCPSASVKAKVTKPDDKHVGYEVSVKNVGETPLTYNLRMDFFNAGAKLEGGFENLQGTLEPGQVEVFGGEEAFIDGVPAVDEARITDVRQCES